MKIDIETLRKVKGFGAKMEEKVIEQYKIDNNIQDKPLYVGEKEIHMGLHNDNALTIMENMESNKE